MGKIKFIGLANTNITDIKKSENVCEISVLQSEYNLFNRSCESELFAKCRELDLGFMSWGTFDKGILTGRIGPHRTFDKSDCRGWAPWWNKKEAVKKAERVIEMQKELQVDLVALALGNNLSNSEISTALCGFRSEEQLESILSSLEDLPTAASIQKAREFMDG